MTMWAGFGRFASPFRAWMALVPLLSWRIGYGFYLAATNVAWRHVREPAAACVLFLILSSAQG